MTALTPTQADHTMPRSVAYARLRQLGAVITGLQGLTRSRFCAHAVSGVSPIADRSRIASVGLLVTLHMKRVFCAALSLGSKQAGALREWHHA